MDSKKISSQHNSLKIGRKERNAFVQQYAKEIEAIHYQAMKRVSHALKTSIPKTKITFTPLPEEFGILQDKEMKIDENLANLGPHNKFTEDKIYLREEAVHKAQRVKFSIAHLLEETIGHEYTHRIFDKMYEKILEDILKKNPREERNAIILGANEAFAYWTDDITSKHKHLFNENANAYNEDIEGTALYIKYFYTLFSRLSYRKGISYITANLPNLVEMHIHQVEDVNVGSRKILLKHALENKTLKN